jgi:hypothetical protein
MKLAVASSAFSGALDRGDLTQLEFVDRAAHQFRCDGVVLDVRHFPRTDGDYLAQVKKMTTDLGLCVAALESNDFFEAGEAGMRAQLAWANAAGAPLVTAVLASETAISWSEQLARLGIATSLAKAANVTIAVRNSPGTFAATSHDCKRVSKETDSAWLRFAFDLDAFDRASDWTVLAEKLVLGWEDARRDAAAERWGDFNGFVTLGCRGAETSAEEIKGAMHRRRIALANLELNRI